MIFQDLTSSNDVSVTLHDINVHLRKSADGVSRVSSHQQVRDATQNTQSDQRSQDDSSSTVTSLDSSSTVASDNTITVNDAPAMSDVTDAGAMQTGALASGVVVNGDATVAGGDEGEDTEVRRYFSASSHIDAETKERSKLQYRNLPSKRPHVQYI